MSPLLSDGDEVLFEHYINQTLNIGDILASRNLMTDIRSANPFFKGKEKVFSNKDRSNFLNMLESECQKLLKLFKD